jgi:hypothetical protein
LKRPNWSKFERSIASIIPDGSITPGSGNGRIKGDVRSPSWLVECKETSKPKIFIQALWFHSLTKAGAGRRVALALQFGEGSERFLVKLEDIPDKEPEVILNGDSMLISPEDLKTDDVWKVGTGFWQVSNPEVFL